MTEKTSEIKNICHDKLNVDTDHIRTELEEIKIANKKLVTAYSETLQKLKSLEDELRNDRDSFENNLDVENKSNQGDNIEEKILLEGKISGYSRTGPQSQSIAKSKDKKTIQYKKCDVCKKLFSSKEALEEHELSHTEDGDWNCQNCGFETNSKKILDKHIKCAHEKSSNTENQIFKNQFSCKFCNVRFQDTQALLTHRKTMHKTFKPCKYMSDCKYLTDCFYNHSQIESSSFICYESGPPFPVVRDLMTHRNHIHETPVCKGF